MLQRSFTIASLCALLAFPVVSVAASLDISTNVQKAMDGEHRSDKNKRRNVYRHPLETLKFFELDADMSVVEIWPGGGWYTEILAPVLKDQGEFYAAGFSKVAKRTPKWRKDFQLRFEAKLTDDPQNYSAVKVTDLAIPERPEIAPANSVDRVFTFRNVHNWMKGEYAEGVFDSMYAALKPGGILGIVEHRAKPGTSLEDMIVSGYVTEAKMIELAEVAGFRLLGKSEVNANVKDTKDYPKGVWSLPPTLRLKEVDRDKYLAIGESDRMTLKFIKD